MEYILETMGLTKIYGQKAAVNDVSLHIPEGVIYGLIGRNGAGKTTIMRMISGLATPTKGSYSLFGKTGYAMGKELKNVGVLIESPGLYPRFSAYDNLKIKCLGMGINPKGYVEQLLETVGLENVDRKKGAGSFSLGMRQRLGIGLALVGDPKYGARKSPFSIAGQALHSCSLDLVHPVTQEGMHFEAPLPEDMQKILKKLRG